MANQEFYSRIIHKHDTEENWIKAVNFIPKQGEIIIYDKDDNYNYERIKIGDGETVVSELSFISDNIDCIDVDLNDAIEGKPSGINADTLGGIPASEYALKENVKPKTAVIILSKSLWVDNEQSISCSIVTADNLAIITPAPESHITYSAYGVRAMTQAAGSLTFACEETPIENLTINVTVLG